jgi:uncharacterized integral membrane protein
MRLSTWILATPVALLAIWIAVANRQPVVFSLDPFSQSAPSLTLQMPLFLLLFAALLTGVLLGGFVIGFRRVARRAAELADVAAEKAANLLPARLRRTKTPTE